MKKRGVDLQRHYRQAFDYWTRLLPNRPRYVVLCNFDQFRVYDFETQMDTPVDALDVTELPARWGPLAFLFPGDHKPTFKTTASPSPAKPPTPWPPASNASSAPTARRPCPAPWPSVSPSKCSWPCSPKTSACSKNISSPTSSTSATAPPKPTTSSAACSPP